MRCNDKIMTYCQDLYSYVQKSCTFSLEFVFVVPLGGLILGTAGVCTPSDYSEFVFKWGILVFCVILSRPFYKLNITQGQGQGPRVSTRKG